MVGVITKACWGADNALWRLDNDGTAERYAGGGRWTPEPSRRLADLSVGSAQSIWGVDAGESWALQLTPQESQVIREGEVWRVGAARDQVYVTPPGVYDIWRRETDGSWSSILYNLPSPFSPHTADNGEVWALAGKGPVVGSPWRFDGRGAWAPAGFEDNGGLQMALGSDGAAWFVNDQKLWRYVGGEEWVLSYDGPLASRQIGCVQGAEVWITIDGQPYVGNGRSWMAVPLDGRRVIGVTCAGDGTVICWTALPSEDVYRHNGFGGWERIPMTPPYTSAGVGDAHHFYTVTAGAPVGGPEQLLLWPGFQWQNPEGQRIQLNRVAAAADGAVWGLDTSNNVCRRARTELWEVFPPSGVTTISIGSDDLRVGLTAAGAPMEGAGFGGFKPMPPAGQAMIDISVGSDGTVIAIGADRTMLRFDRAKQTWTAIQAGPFLSVDAADVDHIAAVTAIDPTTGTNGIWFGPAPPAPATGRKSAAKGKAAKPKARREKRAAA